MLVGFELRKVYDASEKPVKDRPEWLYGAGIVIAMIAFFTVKICEKRGVGSTLMIVLPIIYIGFACTLFRFLMTKEKKLKAIPNNIWKKMVGTISACSLEIYYIQFPWINLFRKNVFPINWVLIVAVTLISAYLLHFVSDRVFYVLVKKKAGE